MMARLNSFFYKTAFCLYERGQRSRLAHTALWRLAKRAGLRALELHRRLTERDGVMELHIDGSRMLLPRKYVEWYAVQGYEALTFDLFRKAVRPGAAVVDVGAHVGSFTLVAARLAGPRGRVLAFEPSAENFELLSANVALNRLDNVALRRCAAGASAGIRRFNIADSSDSNSFYSHPLAGRKQTVDVECVALDEELSGQAVDVVKIDVEGAEPEVLAGLEKTIAANPRLVLFVEFNPCCLALGGHDPRRLLAQLSGWGFSLVLLDERARSSRTVDAASELPLDDRLFHANLYCRRPA